MWLLLLIIALALGSSSAQPAPPRTYAALLKARNLSLWADVLRIAGVGDLQQDASARFVAFVPNDAAVRSFLDSMGLDMAGLRARPRLAKDLAAMHLVLAVPPDYHEAVARGDFLSVPTTASGPHTTLTVKRTAGGVRITDGQGEAADVLQRVQLAPNQSVVIIDKVLLSGSYYANFASLCNHRADLISDVCLALLKSGVLPAGSPDTVFLAGNRGFAAAGFRLASIADNSTVWSSGLGRTLQYGVMPGLHAIPGGFEAGRRYATLLPDTTLAVIYNKVEGGLLEAVVVTQGGQRVPVVVTNVFVGQAIVHGVPAVLKPPPPAAVAAKAAAEAGPASEQPPRRAGGSNTGSQVAGRLLLGYSDLKKVIMPLNTAETQIKGHVSKMTREQHSRWG